GLPVDDGRRQAVDVVAARHHELAGPGVGVAVDVVRHLDLAGRVVDGGVGRGVGGAAAARAVHRDGAAHRPRDAAVVDVCTAAVALAHCPVGADGTGHAFGLRGGVVERILERVA